MSKPFLPDGLWQEIGPLLPPPKPRRAFSRPQAAGTPPGADRHHLCPQGRYGLGRSARRVGPSCGRTCHDYLQKLQEAGIWEQLHTRLLSQLHHADRLDWDRGIVDSPSAQASLGSADTGPNPTDRRKLGSKLPVLTDAQGIPVAVVLSGAHSRY